MSKKKTNEKNTHEIVIKIEGEAWEKALDKAFKEKQKDAKIDGFRKGKVPRDIFEKNYGKEALFIPAADLVLHDAYTMAMDESDLIPVIQPQVDLKSLDDTGVEFTFMITTKPEVKIKEYKGLKIKPEKVKVEKEEIEKEMDAVLEKYTELATKEGKVASGDIAVIDFEGFKDGVAFEGGKGENYSLEIGSNSFIPGFEEAIIDMKTGDEKDLDITFPEDYGAQDLAGQKVVFKVKVNEIKEKQMREFDKELFEDLAMEGVDSKESLEKEIEAAIKARKELEAENKHVDAILEAIGKNVEVSIPEGMVDEEVERLMKKFEQNIAMQGLSLDIYYQFTQSTEEDLKAQLEKEAYSNVLYRLMLEEIMNLEKIEVTVEEAEKEAAELASKYQMEKEEFLTNFGGIEMIQYDLEMRKVIELLKELNK